MIPLSHAIRSLRPQRVAAALLNKIRQFGWLVLLLPALFPLLQADFFVSDDGRSHLYRLGALADAWQNGVLHPRLFPDFGFGYGQAVLNFYSPLGYWPGAALSLLGMNPATAMQWTIGLGFVLAALAAYAYVRSLWGETAGILAALVYTYMPYHLADAYIRGALPEQMAFIFPPLILWAYTAAFRQETGRVPLLWGSLAWAGLVLTHALSTLLMILVAIPHLLLLTWWRGNWRRLIEAGLSLLLAVGLSAPFWLPLLVESRAVALGAGPTQGFVNHMLTPNALLLESLVYPYRDAQGAALVYPLSWLTPLLLAVGLTTLVWTWRRKQIQPPDQMGGQTGDQMAGPLSGLLAYHLALALASMAMITTLALPLWLPLTPILGHLQYPWRFLMVAALGLMVCVAPLPQLLPRMPGWIWAVAIVGVMATVSLAGLPVEPLAVPAAQVWSPQRMWEEDFATGQVGVSWTGEFLPTTVTEQRPLLGHPRQDATDGPPLQPSPRVQVESVGHGRIALSVESQIPFDLRLHQFAQPGWLGEIDGVRVPVTASGELGLATVAVDAGSRQVALRFGSTPARQAGAAIGLVAALLWAALAWRRTMYQRRPMGQRRIMGWVAGLLVTVALALGLNGLGVGVVTRTPVPAQVQLGDTALLIGHETTSAPGQRGLDVTLYWFALRETSANLSVFVHLLGEDGGVIAQSDGAPVGGFSPTSRWRAGEVIVDTRRILLPPEIGPGNYGLKAGLYDAATMANLAVEPPTPDNRIDLGSARVDE